MAEQRTPIQEALDAGKALYAAIGIYKKPGDGFLTDELVEAGEAWCQAMKKLEAADLGVTMPSLWKVRKESNESMALSGTEAWGEVWSVIEDPGRGEAAEQWVGFFINETAANKVAAALGVKEVPHG